VEAVVVAAQEVEGVDMPREPMVVGLKAQAAGPRELAREVDCPPGEEDRERDKTREWAERGLISTVEVLDRRAVSSVV
jgi:hypothetical protein